MKRALFLAAVLFAPVSAFCAESIDEAVMCKVSAGDFFGQLVQRNLIAVKPYQIDAQGVNYFRPRILRPLFAQGMPVTSVIGYVEGQIMFSRSASTPPTNVYGVIVREGIANVQAQLKSLGSDAQTFRIDGQSTAVVCLGA